MLTTLTPIMERAGFRHGWIDYLHEGLHRSQQYDDAATEAELRLQLGVLYQLLAEFKTAREHLQHSATLFGNLEDAYGQARALNRLARVATREGGLDEAEDLANQAMAKTEEKSERAYSYLVLGAVALHQRAWSEAIPFLEKCLTVWEECSDKRMLAWTHTNLGFALRMLNDYDKARNHLHCAVSLFQEIGDPVHQARARVNLGNIYLGEKQYALALDHYLQAEPTFRQVNDNPDLANVYLGIGSAYRYMGQWREAERAYRASAAGWQELNNDAKVANAMHNIGLVYVAQERYDQAIDLFKSALQTLSGARDAPEYAEYKREFTENLSHAGQMLKK
ncbi:MAG: tetratricopeptide repeat protein [Chloroflexi bacterium]|nr:tetratricopeptide repeat protein [Chloroflexota bacterium]